MVKNEGNIKLKSTARLRNPLREISNGTALKSSKSTTHKMKSNFKQQHKTPLPLNQQQQQFGNNEDPLDRLLLVHSDFSSLLRQIDELVVQAVNVNTPDNETIKEIKSFTAVLSEIYSSLKPWVPRLEKTRDLSRTELETQISNTCVVAPLVDDQGDEHSVDTPAPTTHKSLVSPSPLVSWRATGCLEETGKQLFLLTPLLRPKTTTSKGQALSKLTAGEGINLKPTAIFTSFGANGQPNSGLIKVVSESLEGTSDLNFVSAQKKPVGYITPALMTPCLKNPSLRPSALYEPDHEVHNRKTIESHKSTPFQTAVKNLCDSADSESSKGEVTDKIRLKYPELIGIKPSCLSKNESRALEASPAWIMSPPKCCTLLEPLDDKCPKDGASLQQLTELAATFDEQLCLATEIKTDNQDREAKKLCLQGNLRSNFTAVESTPLWKGSESTIHRGKRPAGENTLKRELWTRFEAASSDGYGLKFGVFKDTSHKGFLERLEEASSDESIALSDAFR